MDEEIDDVDVGELLNEPAPEIEIKSQVLRALYHIGKKASDPIGFWIAPAQILKWLEAVGIEVQANKKESKIGYTLKDFGFKTVKKHSDHNYRWIDRTLLMGLIKKVNNGDTEKVYSNSLYTDIKRAVIKASLAGEDVSALDLGCDIELVQKASMEFLEMEEDEARAWLDENQA